MTTGSGTCLTIRCRSDSISAIIKVVDAARMLRAARRRKGLSQRGLAKATGVPQSTIGRIESGAVVPRVDTLDGLLRACDDGLEVMPILGRGVDRSLIAMMLAMSPEERFEYSRSASMGLADLKAQISS